MTRVRSPFLGRCARARRSLAVASCFTILTIGPVAAQKKPAAHKKPTAPDTLSMIQSVDAFTSLDDGQPGALGRWTMQFNLGRESMPNIVNPVETFTSLEYTGVSTHFMRNIELALVVPLRFRPGSTKLGRPIFAWQQRWVADTVAFLTVASLVEYELQTRGEAGDAAAAATGIFIKKLGIGNLFLNTLVGSNNRPALSLWGGRIGYNWWPKQKLSFVADYEYIQIVDSAAQSVLEAGATIAVSHRMSIGPGVLVGLSRNSETPRSGAGVRILWVM